MIVINRRRLQELLLQSLEHERSGVQIYETAIGAAVSEDQRTEWTEYLVQARKHVQIVEGVLQKLQIDAELEKPGTGWARELCFDSLGSLGLDACLPPPGQQRHVKTAIGVARAQSKS
jgi:hypothetical protein